MTILGSGDDGSYVGKKLAQIWHSCWDYPQICGIPARLWGLPRINPKSDQGINHLSLNEVQLQHGTTSNNTKSRSPTKIQNPTDKLLNYKTKGQKVPQRFKIHGAQHRPLSQFSQVTLQQFGDYHWLDFFVTKLGTGELFWAEDQLQHSVSAKQVKCSGRSAQLDSHNPK